jgi:hypothetical protein
MQGPRGIRRVIRGLAATFRWSVFLPSRIQLDPLAQQRGLAETGRGGDERRLPVQARV